MGGRRLGAEELAAGTRQLATFGRGRRAGRGGRSPPSPSRASIPRSCAGSPWPRRGLREGERSPTRSPRARASSRPSSATWCAPARRAARSRTVLARLARPHRGSAALRARLRAALTYPAVMAAATVAVLVFLLAWVVAAADTALRGDGHAPPARDAGPDRG